MKYIVTCPLDFTFKDITHQVTSVVRLRQVLPKGFCSAPEALGRRAESSVAYSDFLLQDKTTCDSYLSMLTCERATSYKTGGFAPFQCSLIVSKLGSSESNNFNFTYFVAEVDFAKISRWLSLSSKGSSLPGKLSSVS